MGEMIGGSDLSPQVGWWHRNRDAIHQLTLKVVLVGNRGREKKVRGQNAWDKVGGHEEQQDKQNGAGVQGGRPK